MNSLNDYLATSFNTQRDQWEKSLKSELKLEDIQSKTSKKNAEGKWPTLSLEAAMTHQLNPLENWKKASQTYAQLTPEINAHLQDDLEAGVRLFFFEKAFLTENSWKKISEQLKKFKDAKDLVVILLGDGKFSEVTELRVIDENKMATGRGAHAPGGNNIQELALLTIDLIGRTNQDDIHLGVFLDTHFFQNIAKVRAAKLLAMKVLEEMKLKKNIYVTGLISYRDWTLYERYSNLLRNDASVASGLIAGCDFVQSSGYQILSELETNAPVDEHAERSRRMARNTSHILALESMLGIVGDASFGSYHLESLTEDYAKNAWELMQKMAPMSPKETSDFVNGITTPVREERQKNLATRRHVLAGLNDFPDTKDSLNLTALPAGRFFRTGRSFEELRLKMEGAATKPDVYLAIFGDYAALNARINFVKNYFELLGLRVTDPGKAEADQASVAHRPEKIVVLISTDEEYEALKNISLSAKEKYLAGKTEIPGFTNLFAGQNVLEILTGISERWGKK